MTLITKTVFGDSIHRRSILQNAAAMAAMSAMPGSLYAATAVKPGALYELPPLPYKFDALAPVIDAETVQLHHDKHHKAYVDALNKALKPHPELQGQTIENLLRGLDKVPEAIRTIVKNNAGGHANHQLFWKIMQPGGAESASGTLAQEINRVFGSMDTFKAKFIEAGEKHFGSGWVFLVTDSKGSGLEIITTAAQDSVLPLKKLALIGNDLWEHAYYLTYRNRRPEYLKAWFDVVNWSVAGERLDMIRRGDEKALGGPA